MRKALLFITIAGTVLTSCEKKSNEVITDKNDDTIVVDTQNSNDVVENVKMQEFAGTYEGILPCADCEGIETIITLEEDGSYSKSEEYLGVEDETKISEQGTYEWNQDGDYVTLIPSNNVTVLLKYKVGADRIIQLDELGNLVEDELADAYVLEKQ